MIQLCISLTSDNKSLLVISCQTAIKLNHSHDSVTRQKTRKLVG